MVTFQLTVTCLVAVTFHLNKTTTTNMTENNNNINGSFSLRKTRRSRLVDILLRLAADRSPHTLKTRSQDDTSRQSTGWTGEMYRPAPVYSQATSRPWRQINADDFTNKLRSCALTSHV